MFDDLLLPLFLSMCIATGFYWVTKTAQRQKLMGRLEKVVPTGLLPGRELAADIRLRRKASSGFGIIGRLLKVPGDVPLAHVVSPTWIFAFGVGACGLFIWFGQILMSLPMSIGVGLVASVLLVRGIFDWEIGRYQTMLVNQLPDTVQLVVSATRAGLPVAEAFSAIAMEMPSPTNVEFTRVVNEMALGGTPAEALLSLYHRTGVAEYAIFAVTIGVQGKSGGRLAETIQNLAETVRERLVIMLRAKALAGEAKLSAIIMGALPIVSGGIQAITQPEQIAVLFNDPRGIRLLAIGIITLLLGALTMRQMIKGATSD